MSIEHDLTRVIDASEQLMDLVDGKIEDINSQLNAKKQEVDAKKQEIDTRLAAKSSAVDAKIQEFQSHHPLTPNILLDTKYFNHIGSEDNVETEIHAAHKAPWKSFLYNGTEGTGTVKRITLDKLSENGLEPNSLMKSKALGSPNVHNQSYYGSNYKVLLLDVEITKGQSTKPTTGSLFVLSQGCDTHFGWSRGDFITQASCWVNVLECTGNMAFQPSANRSANLVCNASDLGKGWQYKHATRKGWGGCHQPLFTGIGRMKVAICLPYVGTGNHGNNMIWADSVGHPYTHTDADNFTGV